MESKEQTIQSCIDTGNQLFELSTKKRAEEINKLSPRSKRRKQLMKEQERSEKNKALFNYAMAMAKCISENPLMFVESKEQ